MDREGLLIKGFDKLSQFFVYYNHPYYMQQMERMGYVKDVDWIEYRISLPDLNDERLKRLDQLANAVARRMKVTPVELTNRASIKPHVEGVFKLYNEAYLALYGMVALTRVRLKNMWESFCRSLMNEPQRYFKTKKAKWWRSVSQRLLFPAHSKNAKVDCSRLAGIMCSRH